MASPALFKWREDASHNFAGRAAAQDVTKRFGFAISADDVWPTRQEDHDPLKSEAFDTQVRMLGHFG